MRGSSGADGHTRDGGAVAGCGAPAQDVSNATTVPKINSQDVSRQFMFQKLRRIRRKTKSRSLVSIT